VNSLWHIIDFANIGSSFAEFKDPLVAMTFWLAVGKIIWINVLLFPEANQIQLFTAFGTQRASSVRSQPEPNVGIGGCASTI